VEASAAVDLKDVHEAFEVCALAAISKQANTVSRCRWYKTVLFFTDGGTK
jgi:hypothetical protein